MVPGSMIHKNTFMYTVPLDGLDFVTECHFWMFTFMYYKWRNPVDQKSCWCFWTWRNLKIQTFSSFRRPIRTRKWHVSVHFLHSQPLSIIGKSKDTRLRILGDDACAKGIRLPRQPLPDELLLHLLLLHPSFLPIFCRLSASLAVPGLLCREPTFSRIVHTSIVSRAPGRLRGPTYSWTCLWPPSSSGRSSRSLSYSSSLPSPTSPLSPFSFFWYQLVNIWQRESENEVGNERENEQTFMEVWALLRSSSPFDITWKIREKRWKRVWSKCAHLSLSCYLVVCSESSDSFSLGLSERLELWLQVPD